MAYDKIIPFPNPNSPFLKKAKVTLPFQRNYRHHQHIWRGTAKYESNGAVITDIKSIIKDLKYKLNGKDISDVLTVEERRYLSNIYEIDKYAGERPDTLLINFREWQNTYEDQQDATSIAMGGILSFVAEVTFHDGIKEIDLDQSFIVADDGVVADASGNLVQIPFRQTRVTDTFGVQNSFAGTFDLETIPMEFGSIKRIVFEDGGKIDSVDISVDKEVVWDDWNRDKMLAIMHDVMGVPKDRLDINNKFVIPFDYLSRATGGLGMIRRDGSQIKFKLRITTNAGGGFPAYIEKLINPLDRKSV